MHLSNFFFVIVNLYRSQAANYADPEKELDHGFYKNTLPLTVQMLQEVGTLCTQNGQENV